MHMIYGNTAPAGASGDASGAYITCYAVTASNMRVKLVLPHALSS